MDIAHVITLDFETFYDTSVKYSLSRMTAEEYINHPEFQVILCGVKVDGAPCEWRRGDDPDFAGWLASFPWETSAAVAHNGAFFDFLIMCWIYGLRPKLFIDTLLLARPLAGEKASNSLGALCEQFGLPPKGHEVVLADGKRLSDFTPRELANYASYCCNDVDRCYDILGILLEHWTSYAIAWMSVTCSMMAHPILEMDKPLLQRGIAQEVQNEGMQIRVLGSVLADPDSGAATELRALGEAASTGDTAPLKKRIGSGEGFADVLRVLGVEPPTKMSEKQQKLVYAFAKTDPLMRDVLENGSDIFGLSEACQTRANVKSTIMHSRLTRLHGIADRMGVMPVPLRPFGAHTGRGAGCLVADTEITVYTPGIGVLTKKIVHVQDTDLVWDGEGFVAHEGVVFSGYREVITHDGVTGTPDHIVFTADGEIPLAEAKARGADITTASFPGGDRKPFCMR